MHPRLSYYQPLFDFLMQLKMKFCISMSKNNSDRPKPVAGMRKTRQIFPHFRFRVFRLEKNTEFFWIEMLSRVGLISRFVYP